MVARAVRGGLRDCYILYNFMSEVIPPLGELINYNLSAATDMEPGSDKYKAKHLYYCR